MHHAALTRQQPAKRHALQPTSTNVEYTVTVIPKTS